jgi:hypothetical protein
MRRVSTEMDGFVTRFCSSKVRQEKWAACNSLYGNEQSSLHSWSGYCSITVLIVGIMCTGMISEDCRILTKRQMQVQIGRDTHASYRGSRLRQTCDVVSAIPLLEASRLLGCDAVWLL